MLKRVMGGVGVVCMATVAVAQPTNIDVGDKYSWSENCGYMNWRDANGGMQGVRIGNTYMAGFVWMENVGWLRVGDGTPGLCGVYGNVVGEDTGVNIAPNGDLYGLAWGENIGWVNFDTRSSLAPHGQQARLDRDEGRLRGYAWGENIGWINLDHAEKFVATTFCRPDWNEDGVVNSGDISSFLTTWIASVQGGDCSADFDASGSTNSGDISSFLTAWISGVTGGC